MDDKSAENVVVIGASAGGLEALIDYVSALGECKSVATVVAQHLSPQNTSMLSELLSRQTNLAVSTITSNTLIRPGCVYITPPDFDVVIEGDTLDLIKLEGRLGPKPSINKLFESLVSTAANDKTKNYVAAIFSGTGSDGSAHLEALRTAGVKVVVQDPETAKYNGMPFSAIQRKEYDAILSTKKFGELVAFGDFKKSFKDADSYFSKSVPVLKEIIDILLRETNSDFSEYKISTLERRIKRRMGETHNTTLTDYRNFLTQNRDEVRNLKQDLLIPVSEFFRDGTAFSALKEQLKRYIATHARDTMIRIWVAGCSTGQEAYSLAIMCDEMIAEFGEKFDYTIFATDIDERALDFARSGTYTDEQTAGLSTSQLNKYFDKAEKGYKVDSRIREKITFSVHDLGRDAPYSRIDIVSCRNLMIYYSPVKQEKFLRLFRYSLNKEGVLFLGQAESAGNDTIFEPLDTKAKIYQRTGVSNYFTAFPSTQLNFRSNTLKSGIHKNEMALDEISLESVTDICNAMFGSSFVLLRHNLELVYVGSKCRSLFSLKSGYVGRGLADFFDNDVATAISASVISRRENPKGFNVIPISIQQSSDGNASKLFATSYGLPKNVIGVTDVVVFAEPQITSNNDDAFDVDDSNEVFYLRGALNAAMERLEAVNLAFQTTTEELQSSNEELQSSNEELQTTNEELQSTNEELLTVNDEMLAKSAIVTIFEQTLDILRDLTIGDTFVMAGNGNIVFGQSNELAISNKRGSLDGLKYTDLRWRVRIGELTDILFSDTHETYTDEILLDNDLKCEIRKINMHNKRSALLAVAITKNEGNIKATNSS